MCDYISSDKDSNSCWRIIIWIMSSFGVWDAGICAVGFVCLWAWLGIHLTQAHFGKFTASQQDGWGVWSKEAATSYFSPREIHAPGTTAALCRRWIFPSDLWAQVRWFVCLFLLPSGSSRQPNKALSAPPAQKKITPHLTGRLQFLRVQGDPGEAIHFLCLCHHPSNEGPVRPLAQWQEKASFATIRAQCEWAGHG